MWVYQQTAADQEFTGHSCPEVSMAPALRSTEPLRPELPDEGSPSQTRPSIQKSESRQISGQKNCWLLVLWIGQPTIFRHGASCLLPQVHRR